MFATFVVMHWRVAGEYSHLPSMNEQRRLQDFESSTGIYLGKTPSLLMGMRKVIYNIYRHILEFGLVRLPPLLMPIRKDVCNTWCYALEFVWARLPPC